MKVKDLSKEQLVKLKQDIIFNKALHDGSFPTWGEMAADDSLVSDKEVISMNDDTDFDDDDFFLS